LAGAPSGRGGNAGPGPGLMRAASPQSPTAIRVTCNLHRPSGAAVPAPARAGEDGGSPTRRRRRSARSRRPRSESPASCTDRAGRQCQSPARAGEGGGPLAPARRGLQSESPASCTVRARRYGRSPARADVGGAGTAGGGPQTSVRVAHGRHRPGRAAWPVPGPVRWVRRVAGVGVAGVPRLLAPAAAKAESGPGPGPQAARHLPLALQCCVQS
jgi:hypothetical protein